MTHPIRYCCYRNLQCSIAILRHLLLLIILTFCENQPALVIVRQLNLAANWKQITYFCNLFRYKHLYHMTQVWIYVILELIHAGI